MLSSPSIDIVVGIDDTGSEGEQVKSRSVDKSRRTLVASIIGKEDLELFNSDWMALVSDLNNEFGVDEFHSSKLWGGTILNSQQTKKDKKIAEGIVLDAFSKAADLCIKHGIGFVVQTVHEETFTSFVNALQEQDGDFFKDIANKLKVPPENRKLAALLLLSRQVLNWTRKVSKPLEVGGKKIEIGVEWYVDECNEFSAISKCHFNFIDAGFAESKFQLVDSKSSCLVQVAEFAAYILNRYMYFIANRDEVSAANAKLSAGFIRAKELLLRVQHFIPLLLNIPVVRLAPKDIHSRTYDELQDEHRASMGLDPLDFKRC